MLGEPHEGAGKDALFYALFGMVLLLAVLYVQVLCFFLFLILLLLLFLLLRLQSGG